METRLWSSFSSLGIVVDIQMKLLKNYVANVAHKMVWLRAGLMGQDRRQPNRCDVFHLFLSNLNSMNEKLQIKKKTVFWDILDLKKKFKQIYGGLVC